MDGLEEDQRSSGVDLEVCVECTDGSGEGWTPVRPETSIGNDDVEVCDAMFGLQFFDCGKSVAGRKAVNFDDDKFGIYASFECFEIGDGGGIADGGDYSGLSQGEIMTGEAETDTAICACDEVVESRHYDVRYG